MILFLREQLALFEAAVTEAHCRWLEEGTPESARAFADELACRNQLRDVLNRELADRDAFTAAYAAQTGEVA